MLRSTVLACAAAGSYESAPLPRAARACPCETSLRAPACAWQTGLRATRGPELVHGPEMAAVCFGSPAPEGWCAEEWRRAASAPSPKYHAMVLRHVRTGAPPPLLHLVRASFATRAGQHHLHEVGCVQRRPGRFERARARAVLAHGHDGCDWSARWQHRASALGALTVHTTPLSHLYVRSRCRLRSRRRPGPCWPPPRGRCCRCPYLPQHPR